VCSLLDIDIAVHDLVCTRSMNTATTIAIVLTTRNCYPFIRICYTCSYIAVPQGSVSVTSLAALCPITKAVAYFSGATSSSSATVPVVATSTVSLSSTSKCPPSPISATTASCTPDVQSPASNTSAATADTTAAATAGVTTTAKPYNNPGIRPRSMPQAHFTAKSEHDRVPETVLAAVRAKPKLQESQQQQPQQQQQQQQQRSRKSSSGSSSAAAVADNTDKHSSDSSGSVQVVPVMHERKRLSVSFADTAAADITERVNSHRTSITCSSVSLNSDSGTHSSASTCSISAPNSPTSVIVDSSSSSGRIFDMRRRASTDITTGTNKLHIM
jgi:hypothetical protein